MVQPCTADAGNHRLLTDFLTAAPAAFGIGIALLRRHPVFLRWHRSASRAPRPASPSPACGLRVRVWASPCCSTSLALLRAGLWSCPPPRHNACAARLLRTARLGAAGGRRGLQVVPISRSRRQIRRAEPLAGRRAVALLCFTPPRRCFSQPRPHRRMRPRRGSWRLPSRPCPASGSAQETAESRWITASRHGQPIACVASGSRPAMAGLAASDAYPLLRGVLFIGGFAVSVVNGMLYRSCPSSLVSPAGATAARVQHPPMKEMLAERWTRWQSAFTSRLRAACRATLAAAGHCGGRRAGAVGAAAVAQPAVGGAAFFPLWRALFLRPVSGNRRRNRP